MIKELSLLLGLLGQPAPSPQAPETTAVQKAYINELEDAKSEAEDSSAVYTYTIAERLVLNTPDTILSSLSESQILSAISMIHYTNAAIAGMQNHDGLNWAPKLNFDGPFHPDSLARHISWQLVSQGNPELFFIFYTANDTANDPLKTELGKRIDEIKKTLVDSLPAQGNKDEKPQFFQLPVVDRNGQIMLNIPYSRKYEDAVAAVALFKLMAGDEIFGLKITDEKYFKASCILRYIADSQIVLDKKNVAWILQKIGASKLFKESLNGQKQLIFERSEIDSLVKLLSNDKSFQQLKNGGKAMTYRGETYALDSVSVFCGYYNSFAIKNLSPVPTDSIFLSFEYGGEAGILQAYLSRIETALSDGKRDTANELLALLVFASEKGIPLCSELLMDRYKSITGSLLFTKSGNPTMRIVNSNENPSIRYPKINGTTIAYNAYCTNAYIIFDYQVGDSATVTLYFSPLLSFNLPYQSKFKIGCNDSQAQGIINIIKRWEDAYKNTSNRNLQKQLAEAIYNDFNSLNNTTFNYGADVNSLFSKTLSAIEEAEAANLRNDKTKQPGKQPTQTNNTQKTTEQNSSPR